MNQDLPDDLVERCAKAMRRDAIARTTNNRGVFDPDVPPSDSEKSNTSAVLREAGVAEMAAALEEFVDAAQYDAMMEGPKFKGWNRSQLDRALTSASAALSRYRGAI